VFSINHTPFHTHQERKTQGKYDQPTTRIVAALLRTPPGTFTLPRSTALQAALDVLRPLAVRGCDDPEHHQSAIRNVLRELYMAESGGPVNGKIQDPAVNGLMLMCLHRSGHWDEPKAMTSKITRLVRAIRLTALVHYHRRTSGMDTSREKLQYFQDKVRHWVLEADLTTFSILQDLQHYVSSLSYSTVAQARIVWIDPISRHRAGQKQVTTHTKLYYCGHELHLAHLRQGVQLLEQRFLTEIAEMSHGLHEKLRVGWDVLADDMTDGTPMTSLFEHPGNPFRDHRNALAQAITEDPIAASVWLDESGTTISESQARRFLKQLASLEMIHLLLQYLTSGSPPRGTEIVSMLVRNTPTMTRNLRGLAEYASTLQQYTKTSNLTQSDSVIPRTLSAFTADICIQIHAVYRPFALTLLRILGNDTPDVTHNYATLLFMDYLKPFKPDSVTQSLRATFRQFLGWDMGIQEYRHIAAAIRRQHLPDAYNVDYDPTEPDEEDPINDVGARQNGHSLAVDRTHYGVSFGALMGAKADQELDLYVECSVRWQYILNVVPAGIHLAFWMATMEFAGDLAMPPIQRPMIAIQDSLSTLHDKVDAFAADTKAQFAAVLSRFDHLERIVVGELQRPTKRSLPDEQQQQQQSERPAKRHSPSKHSATKPTAGELSPSPTNRHVRFLSPEPSTPSPLPRLDFSASIERSPSPAKVVARPVAALPRRTQQAGTRISECSAVRKN
jgi:hypothetical protein